MSIHFLTHKIKPTGDLDEQNLPWKIRFLTKSSLAIIIIYKHWSVLETTIIPWDKTEDELINLTKKPKELVLYAFRNMETEHADYLDGLLNNADDEIYINGKEVNIDW